MTARVFAGSSATDIVAAAELIRQGGLVAVPTDTIYGLAAAVTPDGVQRVFVAKERPADMRLPVLLGTAADLPRVATRLPRVAWPLIDRFWPGPLTLVLPASREMPEALTAGGGTVGVRVPAGRTILRLLEVLGEPITGTSANVSGRPGAATAEEALAQLGDRIDGVLAMDGEVSGGSASTVLDLSGKLPVVRRAGAITVDEIRAVAGMRVEILALTEAGQKP